MQFHRQLHARNIILYKVFNTRVPRFFSLFGIAERKGRCTVKEIEVRVVDNDLEKAMRILKKKIQNDGLFKRLKLKKSFEKPSEYKRRKQREAQRRQRIAAARKYKR
ncbi:ribosomal protein S21 [Desulfobotulus alkaliphilus]|uniref:Small ribosomal subunit protein bS21 n=1 Tax=Desulfobotulus alkaliphilus TaxID=622671 RepID=A0A562SA67_9BACT|nr:ribosomal protein S21 [Desulfobotulus alkaliphilus]